MSYQTKNPIAEALESVRSGIGFPMGDFSQIMYSELGYGVPGSANSFVSNLFCYGQIYGNSGCKKEPLVQLERTAKILYALGVPEDHEVKGRAVLISIDQQKILRFEDFETVNGPNLHIYLSEDLEANNYVDLGKIKATKGNVNYNVDSSVDLEKYDKVLVWCVPFKVLFSYAELS